MLGVAHRDVARDAFVEAELAEETERRGEPLLAVQPFLLDRLELREVREVGEKCSHAEMLCPGATGYSVRSASAGRIRAADRAGQAASRFASAIAAGTTSTTATAASGGT